MSKMDTVCPLGVYSLVGLADINKILITKYIDSDYFFRSSDMFLLIFRGRKGGKKRDERVHAPGFKPRYVPW